MRRVEVVLGCNYGNDVAIVHHLLHQHLIGHEHRRYISHLSAIGLIFQSLQGAHPLRMVAQHGIALRVGAHVVYPELLTASEYLHRLIYLPHKAHSLIVGHPPLIVMQPVFVRHHASAIAQPTQHAHVVGHLGLAAQGT